MTYVSDGEYEKYEAWKKTPKGAQTQQRHALRKLDDARDDYEALKRFERYAIVMTTIAISLVGLGIVLNWLLDNSVFMGLVFAAAFLLIGTGFVLFQPWERVDGGVSRIDSRRRALRKAEHNYEDIIMEGSE